MLLNLHVTLPLCFSPLYCDQQGAPLGAPLGQRGVTNSSISFVIKSFVGDTLYALVIGLHTHYAWKG